MTMALYPSILTQTNLFSPAKPKPLSSTSKPLFLRTPCLILRLHSPTPSSSTFSAKPISQISLTTSLRASSPQKYVYPDPIPEFAEAEIRKFRAEVLRKLLKDKDTFGEELDAVVDVCAEINPGLGDEICHMGQILCVRLHLPGISSKSNPITKCYILQNDSLLLGKV
ncbi:protein PLASTID REDOX INSENSITIVE 2, chloroplastic-like isoform X2 [Quercus lobata]|uniref:protein PLASTID REDOX INSENSITIVE 2, chloroplastic-like isoform X2 n=1 Tax=Quercus lobata TaxID=97700 RepID=UPI001247F46C|nr:protein PLASTID REDOX INSENSITIVE 2, chloroplastic-like isoform X2 [Quercus lobata]XP_030961270.1 protein PLASTID REDOX INSENSITIVE 2, chloroplastic-like isoform X2 [Quercus lobata]